MNQPPDPARFVRPELRALGAYHLDLSPSRHKLDQNEVPWDLPRRFKVRMAERLLAADWARYPDFHADELRRDLGRLHGHPAAGVLVGNGSNELLAVALTALVAPGSEVLGAEPSFGLYPGFVLKAGGVPRFLAAAAGPQDPGRRAGGRGRARAAPPPPALHAEQPDRRRPAGRAGGAPARTVGGAAPARQRLRRVLPLRLPAAARPVSASRPLPHLLQGLVARRHAPRVPAGRSAAGRRADQGEAAVQPRPRGGDRRPRGARGRGRGGAPGAAAGGPPAAVGGPAGRGGVRGLPVRSEFRADPHHAEGAGAGGAAEARRAGDPGARRRRLPRARRLPAGVGGHRRRAAGDAGRFEGGTEG